MPRLDHLTEAQRQAIAGRVPRGLAAALDAGAPLLRELVEARALIRHAEPAMFMHRQVRAGRASVGLMACLDGAAFESGAARPHRGFHSERVEVWRDRIERLETHADPLVIGFDATEEILDLFEREMNDRPLFHVVADDGATHTLWLGTRADSLVRAFAGVREALLLEGHHRAAGAAAGREAMALLVPLRDVTIRASVALMPADAVGPLARMAEEPVQSDAMAPRAGHAWVCLPGAPDGGVVWKSLQVPAAFAAAVAEVESWAGGGRCRWQPGLGIDRAAIEASMRAGDAGTAVLLADPSIEEVRALGAEGALLPAGCTWCDPAFRSGLCMAEPCETATTMRE